MDLQAAKAQSGAKWAWARIGALAFFLLTGILLLASLHMSQSQRVDAGADRALTAGYAIADRS